jgi:PAS domain S-box-containing protein
MTLEKDIPPNNIQKLKELSNYLEELESELAIFFTLNVDLILICKQDGEIIKSNPAWETWLGWKKDELIGRKFYDFIHPDDLKSTQEIAAVLCREPLLTDFQNRYICKDGTYKLLSWRAVTYNNKFYATARSI